MTDTALRLARYFGTTDQFWLNLQTRYNLELEKDRLGERLKAEVRVLERQVLTDEGTPWNACPMRSDTERKVTENG